MTICKWEVAAIELITDELMKDEHVRALDNLKTFRRLFFVETGDIDTGESLGLLLKHGLVYKVEHLHDFNVPDFGITQKGMLVFEHYKFKTAA